MFSKDYVFYCCNCNKQYITNNFHPGKCSCGHEWYRSNPLYKKRHKYDHKENIGEIVKSWLKDNSYDGLYNSSAHWDCYCTLDNLMNCDTPDPSMCKPGNKIKCDCHERCSYHIGELCDGNEYGDE